MTESILTRVKSITLGTDNDTNNCFVWTGIRTVKFIDIDPWVDIDIPYGKKKHQEVKSPHVEGQIHCYDFNAMKTALYETVIDGYNHYAIDATNVNTTGMMKWKVAYCAMTFTDHTGTIITAVFGDFRIRTVSLEGIETGKECELVIRFSADEVTYS
jgi:hypothetical protein